MNDTVFQLLPWQQAAWQQLLQRHAAGQMPHALLLTGPRGIGKLQFAMALGAALLCTARVEDGTACGACKSCQLLRTGAHPDRHHLAPLEDSKVIKIDQVRELCATLAMKSQFGGYKVATLAPAERMNHNAANSLLKTLEEPGADTVIILVTDQPGLLPATIRSRCQVLALQRPASEVAIAWLRAQNVHQPPELLLSLADGAPLLALALDDDEVMARRAAQFEAWRGVLQGRLDPVAVAEDWSKAEPQAQLFWLNSWLMDLVRVRSASGGRLANPDLAQGLQEILERLDLAALFAHLDQVQRAQARLHTSANVQLMFEDLLIPWAERSLKRA